MKGNTEIENIFKKVRDKMYNFKDKDIFRHLIFQEINEKNNTILI